MQMARPPVAGPYQAGVGALGWVRPWQVGSLFPEALFPAQLPPLPQAHIALASLRRHQGHGGRRHMAGHCD